MHAEAHLVKFGITIPEAQDFIFSHIEQPEVIFNTAFQYGVTTEMLSEITDYSTIVIHEFFAAYGFDSTKLDYSNILVNSDLGSLERFVDFNNNTGILSNDSLRESVLQSLGSDSRDIYDFTFEPEIAFQKDDGIYDAEELGVKHLNDVPATNESIESLFYGTLINTFLALDESELNQLYNASLEELPELLFDALNDPPSTDEWNDTELVELVASEAVYLINSHWTNPHFGLLDDSLLGLAAI